MNRLLIALSLTLAVAACATPQAPGTHPNDMTAANHRDACLQHKKEAEANRQRSAELNGGKGTNTADNAADTHNDIAKQHGDAAKAVDPNANNTNDCD